MQSLSYWKILVTGFVVFPEEVPVTDLLVLVCLFQLTGESLGSCLEGAVQGGAVADGAVGLVLRQSPELAWGRAGPVLALQNVMCPPHV